MHPTLRLLMWPGAAPATLRRDLRRATHGLRAATRGARPITRVGRRLPVSLLGGELMQLMGERLSGVLDDRPLPAAPPRSGGRSRRKVGDAAAAIEPAQGAASVAAVEVTSPTLGLTEPRELIPARSHEPSSIEGWFEEAIATLRSLDAVRSPVRRLFSGMSGTEPTPLVRAASEPLKVQRPAGVATLITVLRAYQQAHRRDSARVNTVARRPNDTDTYAGAISPSQSESRTEDTAEPRPGRRRGEAILAPFDAARRSTVALFEQVRRPPASIATSDSPALDYPAASFLKRNPSEAPMDSAEFAQWLADSLREQALDAGVDLT